MRKISALFLLFAISLCAQNQRFIYEYKFKTDSTSTEKLTEEMMFLDVNPNFSKFYSHQKFLSDSKLEARSLKNPDNTNFDGVFFGRVNFVVEKELPSYRTTLFQHLDMDNYQIREMRPLNWKISSEKQKIGEFNTQRADLEIFGRKWTAWFTIEIPLQNGPYKFHGLPGLIVKISDQSETHVFELKGVKKITQKEIPQTEKVRLKYGQHIAVDEKQFKELFIDHRNNPSKGMRQMMSQAGTTVEVYDEKGNKIDLNKHLRDMEERQKEINKANNNLLELDLLK